MRKLRIQFLLFFLLFAGAAGFLLFNSYRQMAGEEKALWVSQSEQIFGQIQSKISDFLNQEDARSFAEYRYYQASDFSQKGPLALSPLSAQLPENDPKGLLGYFQIDPDGSFSTPYLPREGRAPQDKDLRKEREKNLEAITRSLRSEVLKDARAARELEKPVAVLPPEPATSFSSTPNVYPKAVQKKKAAPSPEKQEAAPKTAFADTEKENEVYQKLERRKVASSEVELKAFEEQSQKESSTVAQAPAMAPSPEEAHPEAARDQVKSSLGAKTSLGGAAAPAPAPKPSSVLTPTAQVDRPLRQEDLDTLERKGDGAGFGQEADGRSYRAAPSSPPARVAVKPRPVEEAGESSVLIDPFQARVHSDGTLVFFRKIWLNQKLYLQGFALNLSRFYDWLLAETFENSEVSGFAWADLSQGGTVLARSENQGARPDPSGQVLFERALGYPLNRLVWRLHFEEIPRLAGRFYLNLLAGLIALLGTGGLFFIYRTAAAQVRFSQKRQDFVSAVTHELKTPLTSIRMLSEMLREGWVKEEAKKEEYYHHLHKETSRLSGMIDNVLQLARLEKQTYRLNLKRVSPVSDFDEISEDLKKIAAAQGFQLTALRPDALPAMAYDPEALKEILLIFLDNSMKFAAGSSDKSLHLGLRPVGDYLLWEWQDRGPGVATPELKKIFEKFYRVENEMTRTTKGTGIGLAMAKMIAQALGAKIEAENREGGGLTIRLAFPAL